MIPSTHALELGVLGHLCYTVFGAVRLWDSKRKWEGDMNVALERPVLDKVQAFARQARLASTTQTKLEVAPDLAGALADYLQQTLATAEDQAWFWTRAWQEGEREAEADLAAGHYQSFDTMEDLIDDLGWPR